MDIRNPFNLLRDLTRKPATIPSQVLDMKPLSTEEKDLIRRVGLTSSQLRRDLQADTQVQWDRQRFYHEVNRSLEHWLIGAAVRLYADYACLTGDTRIPLLDGRILTIKEIVAEIAKGENLWVYSCDYAGSPEPSKIVNAVKQKKKPKTFRIWLDNDKYVDASDNHRFIKRDGTLCRVDELEVGDSLMPFHRYCDEEINKGYETVWDASTKTWQATYKMVASKHYDIDLKTVNKGKSLKEHYKEFIVVHHKNFRKQNNNPDNLEVMLCEDHINLHSAALEERWKDPEWREMMIQKNIESHNSPDYKGSKGQLEYWASPESEKRREELVERAKNRVKSAEEIEKLRKANQGKILSTEHKQDIAISVHKALEEGRGHISEKYLKYCTICGKEFYVTECRLGRRTCSDACSYRLKTSDRVERVQRVCLQCGKVFVCKENAPQRFCGSRCASKSTAFPREIRTCRHESCANTFECRADENQRYCSIRCSGTCILKKKERGVIISKAKMGVKRSKSAVVPSYNHKIVKIEYIGEKEVYDVEVTGSHLFGLDAGIYVHNTVMSPIHNASVWITSENTKYYKILSKLLDDIGIEEKIFDWAWTTAAFGDLFVEIDGRPSLGIVSINDDRHPLQVNRVDHNGILIGYTESRLGSSHEHKLLPPWKFVHLRLLGAKRKRPVFSDPLYSEFRTMNLMSGTDTRMVSSKYGASLLLDAMPTYKRLKLAEDSLLLARMTRGITRYIWKLAVNHTNMEAVQELIDQIATTLKRARSLNTSDASPYYDSKENPMGVTEDIFMPVWGDNTNALTFDEIGGKPDIRWIVDIDGLRNQLACTLRTPLQLLGGYVDEATGALGSESIEKLDIGFARNARRLQRAMRQGIKRICQIHLAYQNMDPDPALFEVQMSETSTAEEEVIKGTFETGIDIIDRVIDIMEKIDPNIDKEKVFDYMNMKILKLEGFNLSKFKKVVLAEGIKEVEPEKVAETFKRYPIGNTDLVSYLPLVMKEISEGGKTRNVGPNLSERSTVLFAERWGKNWEYQYSKVKAIETKGGRVPHNSEANQMTFKQLREKKEAEAKAREDELLLVEI